MITIDGTLGEGGGQILRTSLALSLITGKPFVINDIRGRRKKPGLLHQHLTAVRAAAAVGAASLDGAELGSRRLRFTPAAVLAGEYHFAVGTAGSAGLVLQTILPALLTASQPSRLVLEGGTHNAWAPPFEFLARAFLPLINRMGPRVSLELVRHGFYPAGGGSYRVMVEPSARLQPFDLPSRGELVDRRARILSAHLPPHVARREARVVQERTGWPVSAIHIDTVADSAGPGNAVILEIRTEHLTEVFTAFGARGVRAEQVADAAVTQAETYLESGAAVGEHLGDQLILPLALAGRGSFTAVRPSLHATTNIEVIRRFLDVTISAEELDQGKWRIAIAPGDALE